MVGIAERLPSFATSETSPGWQPVAIDLRRGDGLQRAVGMRAKGEDLLPPFALPW